MLLTAGGRATLTTHADKLDTPVARGDKLDMPVARGDTPAVRGDTPAAASLELG